MRKKALKVAIALILGAALIFPATTHAAAPTPTLHQENANGNFGNWYTGAVPPQASPDKPVLLFVQGLHSKYERWTGPDSYYEAAYNAGYRTAFVQLRDADGDGGSMWTNGEVLAGVIRKIAAHYGVSKINIIAHSKGGIDTQTALVHYGASPYVNVVHQLSTPNKGSELADMAYSTWTSWLGAILGKQDDAVYSLQTSYMANYRAQTDNRAENQATNIYMSAGTGDDGLFSSTWFAHAVLPGEDDGAVAVYSALGLPYGIHSFTKNLSHSSMAKASQTWSLVQPKLTLGTKSSGAFHAADSQAPVEEALTASPFARGKVQEEGNVIMRGGPVEGSTSVSLPLESGISSVSLEVMTSRRETQLTLVSPSGRIYEPQAAPENTDPYGIFDKAVKQVFQVAKPEAGDWILKLNGQSDAYFIQTQIENGNPATVKASKKVYRQGETSELSVDFGKPIKGFVKRPKLTKSVKGSNAAAARELAETSVNGSLKLPFAAPAEPGVYNISFDVEGLNDKGEKVIRSINYNFAVTDQEGKLK